MKLKELYDLLSPCSTPVKVISSGTGKVLIHRYSPVTHSKYDELKVIGIFPELYLSGLTAKDMAMVRLVVWASDYEFDKLKKEGVSEV